MGADSIQRALLHKTSLYSQRVSFKVWDVACRRELLCTRGLSLGRGGSSYKGFVFAKGLYVKGVVGGGFLNGGLLTRAVTKWDGLALIPQLWNDALGWVATDYYGMTCWYGSSQKLWNGMTTCDGLPLIPKHGLG
eukprot:5283556-Amphidinium_carterae.1